MDEIEALLTGEAGGDSAVSAYLESLRSELVSETTELTRVRHLRMIRDALGTSRRVDRLVPHLSRAAAAVVVLLVGVGGAAAAGALPQPIQRLAATVGSVVGVSIPAPTAAMPEDRPMENLDPMAPSTTLPPTTAAPAATESTPAAEAPTLGQIPEEPAGAVVVWEGELCDGTAVAVEIDLGERIQVIAVDGPEHHVDLGRFGLVVGFGEHGSVVFDSDGAARLDCVSRDGWGRSDDRDRDRGGNRDHEDSDRDSTSGNGWRDGWRSGGWEGPGWGFPRRGSGGWGSEQGAEGSRGDGR